VLCIFLDTETNGLNPFKYQLLEIALAIIDAETGTRYETYESVIQQPRATWDNSLPESLKVNGFTWEEVEKGRPLNEVASAIETLFTRHSIRRGEAVFICQNPSFDRAFFSQLFSTEKQEALQWPYHWLDLASMYWSYALLGKKVMPWKTGYSKDKIAAVFGLPSEKQPHRARNGMEHLLQCYTACVGFPKR
jgi:oligoribonuclease